MPPQVQPFNLFAYGTLMDPSIFRAVLGRRMVDRGEEADQIETYHPRPAILDGYKKISPDNTYLYAVPDPQERIRGLLIGPLPHECMRSLRHYEGRNYSRKTLPVQTGDGSQRAVVFVGNLEQLEHSFGYAFRDPLKQEILLRKKIESALLEAERKQLHTETPQTRRAVGELMGTTVRDLMRQHFDAGGISDYAIRHSITDTPLRDFTTALEDPEGRALASNYLRMVIRQVIFNEIEEKIRDEFRFELDQMNPGAGYYERTVSSLAGLRIVNRNSATLDTLSQQALSNLDPARDHLVDFVQWAVTAADAMYDSVLGRRQIFIIRNHMGGGYIPMGAELEFSNIGHAVIRDPEGQAIRDRQYDGFLFFSDFALDALTWKLGGHVDDHREKSSTQRRRGFFETALGNVSIERNLSKPITDDPWLLNQIIHEARRFYDIAPHSVHISLQLRRQHKPDRDRVLPLSIMKPLFAIAGDPACNEEGKIQIKRLVSNEIITADPVPHMLFSEITRRRSSESEQAYQSGGARAGRYVQQFRFLRLSPKLSYEPIIMGLKGLQIALRPGTFMTGTQYEQSSRHRRLFENLIEWGAHPEPLAKSEIRGFLDSVREGLLTERRGKPAHTKAYIEWALTELRQMLDKFNTLTSDST